MAPLSDANSAKPTADSPAKLAIIIDDLGYNLRLGQRTLRLPGDITVAVLPFTPHGRELAEYAHQQGKEVMLHVPMSSHHHYPLGRGGLISGMGKSEFLAIVRTNLASLPHIKGVNNHMGSQLTEEPEPMSWLMAELQQHQLYFVDSRTSAKTQALIQAQHIGLPSRRRDVFLDDKRDLQIIHQQLRLALTKAQQQGSAIAIGHPYPETLQALEQLPALLAQYQVQLVKASHLMPPVSGRAPTSRHRIDYCLAPPMSLWPHTWVPINPFDTNPHLWEY